jgi:hypothetical protein
LAANTRGLTFIRYCHTQHIDLQAPVTAVGMALKQLSGASGAEFRRRWLDDHVLSDAVLSQAVPDLVSSFAPEYQVRSAYLIASSAAAACFIQECLYFWIQFQLIRLPPQPQPFLSQETFEPLSKQQISQACETWLEQLKKTLEEPVRKALRQVSTATVWFSADKRLAGLT